MWPRFLVVFALVGCRANSPEAQGPPPVVPSSSPSVAAPAAPSTSDRWIIDNAREIHGLVPTLIGAPSVGTSPQGPALCFDGNDGILLEKNPLEGLAQFTLEVYVRIDGVSDPALSEPRYLHIEAKDGGRATIEARVTPTEFHLDTFLRTETTKLTLIDPAKRHPVGRWNWTALTYADGQMRHFVDAIEDASGSVTVPPMVEGKMSLGVRQNLVHYLTGCIREVRVTPKALTAGELQRAGG